MGRALQDSSTSTSTSTVSVEVPASFFRRLEALAIRHDRTVIDLVQHAVDVQYGDDAVTARLRLVDRLARLEARLGDVDSLLDDVARESRITRADLARRKGSR
jgi:hypothetical protein